MKGTISKTRELLVDVARQLFARMGVHNTTMNDIANASKRGRRTLYTYFKSKDEIYQAVVEEELKKLKNTMIQVTNEDLTPEDKLITFIYTRLEAIKEVVQRNGSLRADFFRDIWRVQRERRKFDELEIKMLCQILQDGIDKGVFAVPNVRVTAAILHHAFKGLEVPYIRDVIGTDKDTRKENIKNILFNGLKTNKNQ
ncbi:MAG: TetR/AcrR family transcriptional regulator [Bacteroidales bacterium]|nr:TetR/AcrR family transcriptional regulator [Bacteroidales bacterium]